MKILKIEEDKKTGKILFESGIFFLILNVLCITGIWQSIMTNWQVSGDAELFSRAYIEISEKYRMDTLNQQSLYLSLLALVFSFLGNKEEMVLIVNLILQLLGIIFLFAGMRKIAGAFSSLVIAIACAVSSIFFFSVAVDSPMHFMWFLCGFAYWLCAKILVEKKNTQLAGTASVIVTGILLGMVVYVDFSGIFPFITTFVVIMHSHPKKRKKAVIFFLLSAAVSFFGICYLWNHYQMDFALLKQWFWERKNFLMQQEFYQQYLSISVLFFLCLLFGMITYRKKDSRETDSRILVTEEVMSELTERMQIDDIEMIELAGKKQKDDIEMIELSGKEQIDDIEMAELSGKEQIDDIEMAEFSGKEQSGKEEITETMENEAESLPKKEIKFLENPLPVPKKHVKKEMTYAFEPREDQMHYDLNNYCVEDDYDLKVTVQT